MYRCGSNRWGQGPGSYGLGLILMVPYVANAASTKCFSSHSFLGLACAPDGVRAFYPIHEGHIHIHQHQCEGWSPRRLQCV